MNNCFRWHLITTNLEKFGRKFFVNPTPGIEWMDQED